MAFRDQFKPILSETNRSSTSRRKPPKYVKIMETKSAKLLQKIWRQISFEFWYQKIGMKQASYACSTHRKLDVWSSWMEESFVEKIIQIPKAKLTMLEPPNWSKSPSPIYVWEQALCKSFFKLLLSQHRKLQRAISCLLLVYKQSYVQSKIRELFG